MISGKTIRAVLAKAMRVNSRPTEETFPELPEVLVWFRCLLGLTYGVFLGTRLAHGGALLIQALNLITFMPFLYARYYLGADAEAWGPKLIFSGTLNALALCILIWIYFYTAANKEEELKLTTLLGASIGNFTEEVTAERMEESEF